jgi:hypothetical protein
MLLLLLLLLLLWPLSPLSRGRIPRRSRWFPPRRTKAHGFPCRPIRDARSAEWELMSALSLTPNVRGHGFQMHHYRDCAGDPLKNLRCEPLSLLIFLCGGKESKL